MTRRMRKFAVRERLRESWRIRKKIETGQKTIAFGAIFALWACGRAFRFEPPWCYAVAGLAAVIGVIVSIGGLRAARRSEARLAEHRQRWSPRADGRRPVGEVPR